MASPVKVKPEPVNGDVFCADTDSEDDDIDVDKLQPLAPKLASLSKFPTGCPVWYNLRTSPETGHMQAKSARVVEVSIHFENGRRVYKVKPEAPEEHMNMTSFYEDQLVYAICCQVRLKKKDSDETLDGVVVYLEREKGNDGRRQVTYAVQYSVDDCVTIEPRVAADRIKYRVDDCGVGVKGKDSKMQISTDTKKQTTSCAHEGDTGKEEKEAEVSSFSSTAKSFAPVEHNDHIAINQLSSLDIINPRWEPPSSPSSQQKRRSSASEPKDRPTKVAKREDQNGEKCDVEKDTSKGKAGNNAAVRILTIPSWWENQWRPENRRQLYSRLVGRDRMFKSSFNCSIRVSGSNLQDEMMRITIESFCRDPKSKRNSIRHASDTVEKILGEYLADQNSMKRLLFDLSLYASDSLQWRDSDGELLLVHRDIYDSQGSTKEWWYLHELRCGREMHPHHLSSLRLKLLKGLPNDCMIEVFGRSAKVSREFPYVLVSGTKQLDVKNAALMVKMLCLGIKCVDI